MLRDVCRQNFVATLVIGLKNAGKFMGKTRVVTFFGSSGRVNYALEGENTIVFCCTLNN